MKFEVINVIDFKLWMFAVDFHEWMLEQVDCPKRRSDDQGLETSRGLRKGERNDLP